MYAIRPASPPARGFTRRPRPGGPASIVQVQWHATRGAFAMDRQVAGTESWFASTANGNTAAGNPRGWGGSAEFVVGPDYRRGGAISIVRFGDTYQEHSSWSAGAGAAGTLYASRHGIAIEVAQPAGRDAAGNYTSSPNANFEHFTDETIAACVWLVGQINRELRALGVDPVPATHIESWAQLPRAPVPAGHIGHEDLANGLKRSKHDPGHLFPWDLLMTRIRAGEVMPPPVGAPDLATLRERQAAAEANALVSFTAARQMLEATRAVSHEIDELERR